VSGAKIESLTLSAYTVPTDAPESDSTLRWDSTTIVLVEAAAGGERGLGYTYGDVSTGKLIESKLSEAVRGKDAMRVQSSWAAMQRALRNAGRPGIGAMAVSAVDVALWDLKARLLEIPLADLLGRFNEGVPVYGSGGFTSYSVDRLREQLSGWVAEGFTRVKMKVGREPEQDLGRVIAAREAIGPDAELMVDANGAYARKQALEKAQAFSHLGVVWYEEPVSSDDLEGLRLVRDRGPSSMSVAAGEYGYDIFHFYRLLEAGAVDVLQADVTRCAGITGLLRVDALCKAHNVPLSAHCAPQIHAHACCATETLIHCEYFHDHARIERMLFDGALSPKRGVLTPDPSSPGLGIELKRADAERYAA
jgi:L-alanine-DL-glutamate epimerase-like enolase superfamily enzyme